VLEILGEFQRLPRRRITGEWYILTMLGEHAEAVKILAEFDNSETVFQLASWLTYPSFDPSPYPFLVQMLERENIDRPPAVPIPFACPDRAETD
jgi:hypothetical protein